MAENKKSFVAYCEWAEIFDALSDEQAGKLVKHLFKYVNDENPISDQLTELLFIQFRQVLKRDLKKYENYIDKQSDNGKKGGRPKAKETQKTQAFFSKPKKADNVNVNVNVNDNDIINNNINNNKVFSKPKIDDIKNYCLEKNNGVDSEKFYYFYESKDWMIGKNKMKDWKAAIRTWEKPKLNIIKAKIPIS